MYIREGVAFPRDRGVTNENHHHLSWHCKLTGHLLPADSKVNEVLLSDEEVIYRVNQSSALTTTRAESIRALLHHLVAKPVQNHRDGIFAMETARPVGVNVPAVRHIIHLSSGNHLIVMERIHGETRMRRLTLVSYGR